jgi:very-short-patch-repair endonuclease
MKLAVELDGGQHNQCKNKEHDAARSEYLKAHGIEVIRFWNHEVLLNLDSILSELGGKVTPLRPPLHLRGEYWEVSLRFRSVYPLNTQMNL